MILKPCLVTSENAPLANLVERRQVPIGGARQVALLSTSVGGEEHLRPVDQAHFLSHTRAHLLEDRPR